MRITDRYSSPMDRVAPSAARPVDKTERADSGSHAASAKAKTPAAGGALEVSVSGRAQELASRTARIDELRAAIKVGSFRVDSQRIAQRLVGLVGEGEG